MLISNSESMVFSGSFSMNSACSWELPLQSPKCYSPISWSKQCNYLGSSSSEKEKEFISCSYNRFSIYKSNIIDWFLNTSFLGVLVFIFYS